MLHCTEKTGKTKCQVRDVRKTGCSQLQQPLFFAEFHITFVYKDSNLEEYLCENKYVNIIHTWSEFQSNHLSIFQYITLKLNGGIYIKTIWYTVNVPIAIITTELPKSIANDN